MCRILTLHFDNLKGKYFITHCIYLLKIYNYEQLVTTRRYHDAFAWLATARDNNWTSLLQFVNRLVASCLQTCCKLIIVSTSCGNKSANDKMQQAWSYNRPIVSYNLALGKRHISILSTRVSYGRSSGDPPPPPPLLRNVTQFFRYLFKALMLCIKV